MSSNEIAFVLSGQTQGGLRGDLGAQPSRSVAGTVKASVRLSARRAMISSARCIRASSAGFQTTI